MSATRVRDTGCRVSDSVGPGYWSWVKGSATREMGFGSRVGDRHGGGDEMIKDVKTSSRLDFVAPEYRSRVKGRVSGLGGSLPVSSPVRAEKTVRCESTS